MRSAANGFLRRAFPSPPRPTVTRLVVVGDVHDGRQVQWTDADVLALRALRPDITLFVGDFGNGAVETVRQISKIELPKVVVLGNHDAWRTPKPMLRATLDRTRPIDDVNLQLDMLGEDHISFRCRSLPDRAVSVVGARPFTSGGPSCCGNLMWSLYGLDNHRAYADAIVSAAKEAPKEHVLVIVGHNGPTGLDFRPVDGDHGDPDLRLALESLANADRSPALVTFGHMHHVLKRIGDYRKRVCYDAERGTLFLNTAVVPRLRPAAGRDDCAQHHFCVVEIEGDRVSTAHDVYVDVRDGELQEEVSQQLLFSRTTQDGRDDVLLWNAYLQVWEGSAAARQL